MKRSIQFVLNGKATKADCRPDMTVLEWLRGEALLRGTKEGCAEGDCGACSVLLMRRNVEQQGEWLPANSCILLMGQLEGTALMTVEGLAAEAEDGHAVQRQMAENGSSQCGFCTPGIAVSLAGLLQRKEQPNEAQIHDALAGNLCRCTGYRPIVEAAQSAANSAAQIPLPTPEGPAAEIGDTDCSFYLPGTLDELLSLLADHPEATLLAGGTDIVLDVAHARARWPKTILTRHVAELRKIEASATTLTFGGAVTWEEALPHLERHWPSFATLVRRFGSTQIRSMGTIAGNLGTASPIGDGAPALLVLGAYLILAGPSGEREMPLDEFFLDYRKSALDKGEIIRAICVPLPTPDLTFRVYKVSKRYDQDISTVCGAFALKVDGETIVNARVAYGGMAAIPKRCIKAEAALEGERLDGPSLTAAKKAIEEAFSPMSDMRGSATYRSLAAANLLERFALDIDGETVEVMAL